MPPLAKPSSPIIADLLLQALREPADSRAYWMDRELRRIFKDRAIILTTVFDAQEHANSEGYSNTFHPRIHSAFTTTYHPGYGLFRIDKQVWRVVDWQGNTLDLVELAWSVGFNDHQYTWIIADTIETAETYLSTVSQWNSEVRGEILFFDGGCWSKSTQLYDSIQAANFENLILPAALKGEIQTDFGKFVEARSSYERFGVPWKRGVLFHGPPGNGKTHTLKALINWLQIPCLYVKSLRPERFQSEFGPIQAVFERARTTTPCLLVMEDLDSLINDANRAFFLNELDGFASNTGIILVATTNHPERLDPALLNRPSRFDRKYEFALPDLEERSAYLKMWSNRSEDALKLSEEDVEAISAVTGEFSFAYLKELWLSSMTRWMEFQRSGEMVRTVLEQVPILRAQMSEGISEGPPVMDEIFVEIDE